LITVAAVFAAAAAFWYLQSASRSHESSSTAVLRFGPPGEAIVANATASKAPRPEQTAARAAWSDLPLGFERNQRIERDGYEIASHDLSAAWEKLGLLEDPAERAGFLRGMFVAIAARAPREAMASIKKVDNADERNLAMETVANAWRGGVPASSSAMRGELVHASDPARLGLSLLNGSIGRAELALVWAEELVTVPAERAALLGAATAAFTLKDSARVAAVSASLPDDASREIFRDQFAQALRFVAGDAAWSSAQSLPPGDLRNAAQSSILRAWSASDPEAAASAIATLPDNDERTYAVAVLAESWAARDTESALAWAASLDPENRAAAEEAIGHSAPVGIGAVIAMSDDGYPLVRELLAGGAAERAAVIPTGSKIVAVLDGQGQAVETHGRDLGQTISQLRGAKGTAVTMLVQAPGESQPRRVTIVREQIIHKTAKK